MSTREDAERRYAQIEGERDYYRKMTERQDGEIERLQEVERLARAFARAKGRHHSQHAMCDLLEHFGMPCVRPGEDKPYHASELPKVWELYRHHNGSLYRVEMITNVDSDRPEYPVTVCYRGEDGLVWSKTLSEFLAKMTRAEEPD